MNSNNNAISSLTLGSLFDGSGGFPLGGLLSGITPIFASEVEPFPIRVTTKRLPFIKHYGDICKINGAEIEPVDIITFGSPCTDLSVAGKRVGIDGSRSSLFFEAIRIIREMRIKTNGKYPRWIVWENVPGAYSSGNPKGSDFLAVLTEIIKIKDQTAAVPMPNQNKWLCAGEIVGDDYSVAWRTLDAQFWGVAQRRRRIYLVADFAKQCASKVLFESEGLSGYYSQSGNSWQGTAGNAEKGTGNPSEQITCLNDQGGQRMDVTENITTTLRAEAHHPPCVLQSAGFCTEHSAKSRGIGFEEECSPTLRAGVVPATVSVQNHASDSRIKLDETGRVQALTARMGTGGMNVPLVMNLPKTLKILSGCPVGGGKGALVQNDLSATLSCNNEQTVFVPKAFGICSDGSNSMLSDNPYSGIYEADTARTLDGNGGNPSCNQGGIAVVEETPAYSFDPYNNKQDEVMPSIGTNCGMSTGRSICLQGSMIGRDDKNGPKGSGINEEVSFTLDATSPHAVVYALDRETFNCGQNFARNLGITEDGVSSTLNAQGPSAVAYAMTTGSFSQVNKEKVATLAARDYKDAQIVAESMYTVRRLTPTECALLQGFPADWCANLETEEPTEADISFWTEVFETHRTLFSPKTKPKSRPQIIKWLKNPHSDSAEYKMWGNGISLPVVCFVLAGIVWADNL